MSMLIVKHKVEFGQISKSKLKLAGVIAIQQEVAAYPLSIEYSPVTATEVTKYSKLIEKECLMRGISLFTVNEEEQQGVFRNQLAVESENCNFQKDVEHLEIKENSL
eukprot:10779632-Ditylum_brightwellii.AAC.1